MRYNELIIDPLNEAQLSPGEVREIKLKLSEYEAKLDELKRKENKLRNEIDYNIDSFPKELHDKINAYIAAYTREINKLKDQLKADYPEDSFNNFVAGIRKNCSEIVDFYKTYRTFLYTGFKNAQGKTALYGKPPAKIDVPNYYRERRFDDLAEMLEDKFKIASFDNCLLASGDAFDVNTDGRTAFIIFPRNGFKYFYMGGIEKFMLSDARIAKLFDKDIIKAAWDYFIGNPQMFEDFKSAGGFAYEWGKDYAGTIDGFMGRYQWENNVATITKLVKANLVSDEMQQFMYLKNWVSYKSFSEGVELKTENIKTAMSYGYDIALSANAVYAVSTKLQTKMERALGMRD
jgi:hypothetical protein